MESQTNTPGAPGERPTKADVLLRISQSWGALEELIGQLDEADLTAPAPDGGWSVKDHLAHLTAWEKSLLGLLAGRPRYEAMGVDRATYESGIDPLNAALERRAKDQPLVDVLNDYRRTHQRVLDTVERLSDADLYRPYSAYQPDSPDNQAPVVNWIAGNTFGHYDEHRATIQALIERGRQR